jgi:hypothetical protein
LTIVLLDPRVHPDELLPSACRRVLHHRDEGDAGCQRRKHSGGPGLVYGSVRLGVDNEEFSGSFDRGDGGLRRGAGGGGERAFLTQNFRETNHRSGFLSWRAE